MSTSLLSAVLLSIVLISTLSTQYALAGDPDSLRSTIENFTENLKNEIRELVTESTGNDSTSLANVTNTMLRNGSNVISNQVITSNNDSLSNNTNRNATSITNQVTTVNGVCTSTITGGAGSETLSSKGVCNDKLTGGWGADRFVCGEGTDTIRDFNASEGDIIVDPKNCETLS
jgi:hypothetical protein